MNNETNGSGYCCIKRTLHTITEDAPYVLLLLSCVALVTTVVKACQWQRKHACRQQSRRD